jgi:hypothetical protein
VCVCSPVALISSTNFFRLVTNIVQGNRVDCELYASSLQLMGERLEWMEREQGLVRGVYSTPLLNATQSPLCTRAALAYRQQQEQRQHKVLSPLF